MAVALYARVSTEEQRERQSINTQRDFGVRYCDLHQLDVYETYTDDGVSGTVAFESRSAGGRLLDDARRGRFDQLLVFKLDRLGRDTRLILNAVAELEKSGVRVRSMTEEFDTATATGRLMLTMLSGFAAHEREVIRERSMAGTKRLVEAGAWLGGVVPYGYRKEGERVQGRLALNENQIAGMDLSEVDVVRLIYRMSATEKKSCQKIADHLNAAAIPCGSEANAPSPGKRGRRTATIWRPSHVRNMIVSPTYMGQHLFGKRSKNRSRAVITRAVPAIVSEETWTAAQLILKANRLASSRNRRRHYLLRGLIKCGLCGLTFSGMTSKPPQRDHYYRCNGRQLWRGLYGLSGKKCPGKGLNGDFIERLVWADIESFLRNPGEILERLRERVSMQDGERQRREKELKNLKDRWEQKGAESDRVLGLFRRGRIDDNTLDQQLDQINSESFALHAAIEAETRALSSGDRTAQLRSAEGLLKELRNRLDGPIPFEIKRRIVETLVERVQADTIERCGVEQSQVTITYRFSKPSEPAALVFPRSHRVDRGTRPVEELKTLGDHMRRRRLTLKLLQREVGDQLGVDKTSIYNWETNRCEPSFEFMPTIIRFLGYDPEPQLPSSTVAQKLVRARKVRGLSQKEAAHLLDVDPSTLARWERGEREPAGAFSVGVARFLASGEHAVPPVARTA